MADVVRLSIVYDTSQAVASANKASESLGRLGRVSTAGSTSLRGMALAGIRLSQGLASGNLSAMALATSLGRLAGGAVLGAVVVSTVAVITAFKEFKRITDDVTSSIDAMQTAARDAKADVARLLGEAPAESNAEKAIKRLRDAAAQLRKEAAKFRDPITGNFAGAGILLAGQADALEGQIPGIGARAAAGRARAEREKRANEEREFREKLTGPRTASNRLAGAMNFGRLGAMLEDVSLLRRELDMLAGNANVSAAEIRRTANALIDAENRLGDFQRSLHRMEDLLFTLSEGVLDFVMGVEGAFRRMIENVFALLYRDFTGQFIEGLVSQVAFGTAGTGSVSVGGATSGGPLGSSQPVGSGPNLQMHFNVATPDAAAWIDQNGDRIAAAVARKFNASRSYRTKAMR